MYNPAIVPPNSSDLDEKVASDYTIGFKEYEKNKYYAHISNLRLVSDYAVSTYDQEGKYAYQPSVIGNSKKPSRIVALQNDEEPHISETNSSLSETEEPVAELEPRPIKLVDTYKSLSLTTKPSYTSQNSTKLKDYTTRSTLDKSNNSIVRQASPTKIVVFNKQKQCSLNTACTYDSTDENSGKETPFIVKKC